jgi:hypothetical protein
MMEGDGWEWRGWKGYAGDEVEKVIRWITERIMLSKLILIFFVHTTANIINKVSCTNRGVQKDGTPC